MLPLKYRSLRKATHIACFVAFVALPFLDVMRFDLPRQRFYFAGQELWISEFIIIFFALMFLLFLVAATAMLCGRVYCSYLCPQMIFSEASMALEKRIARLVSKHIRVWSFRRRELAGRLLFHALLMPASVLLAFVFLSYFVEPRDLLRRLLSLDVSTAGGIAGATTTIIIFLDFAFLRLRFCTTVCPYGYLQGMLADGKTLLVTYTDAARSCIECSACVRVCHMGIDIRTSPYQIECVHCGECIDACRSILARIGKHGLIDYTWGASESGSLAWYRKTGLADAKRVAVLLVVMAYAAGLLVALGMRKTVLVRISPDRSTLYEVDRNDVIGNRFRVTVANRGRVDATVALAIDGFDRARLDLLRDPIRVASQQTVTKEFVVSARAAAPGVTHFNFLVRSSGDDSPEIVPMTFISPAKE